jgi:hypothetical protein
MEIKQLEIGGTIVSVEVEPADGRRQASGLSDEAMVTFQHAQEMIQGLATGFHESVSRLATSMKPNEIELQFGLKLTAEAGWLVSKVGGEAGFEIKLKWVLR